MRALYSIWLTGLNWETASSPHSYLKDIKILEKKFFVNVYPSSKPNKGNPQVPETNKLRANSCVEATAKDYE